MKLLIVIDGPDFTENPMSGRLWQNERTNLAAAIKLLASRVEMGLDGGTFKTGDVTIHFKTELTPTQDEEAA
jgi:hypothetical protein